MFGQFWLMHELTGSPLYLGYIGMANAVPAILLNLVGGVVADKLDKKLLVVLTMALLSMLVLLLGFLTFFSLVKVWHVMAIGVFTGAINAFNQPARMSLYPTLVPRKALTSAVALNSVVWQATRIVAPAFAGLLIAFLGTAAAFFMAGLGMIVFAWVVQGLHIPKIENGPGVKTGQDLLEGLRFIKDNSIFAFLIGMTFFISFFGMSYMTQMPVFAVDILHIGADGQGVLLSISGVGSIIITLWIGSIGSYRRKGLVLIGAATLTGLSVAGFALSCEFIGSYVIASVFMFGIGVFTSACNISIMSSLQIMVPEHLRGRVMGFYGMTWDIMPLGGLYVGIVAGFIGAPFAVSVGGFLVSLFAIGPALINRQVRTLGTHLNRIEDHQ